MSACSHSDPMCAECSADMQEIAAWFYNRAITTAEQMLTALREHASAAHSAMCDASEHACKLRRVFYDDDCYISAVVNYERVVIEVEKQLRRMGRIK